MLHHRSCEVAGAVRIIQIRSRTRFATLSIRSVPFIEHQVAEWIAKKYCISCHHTAFMVWSLNAATRNGVPVDQTKLDAWTEWATNWKHLVVASVRATAVREDTLRDQPYTLAQLLLGRIALIPGRQSAEMVSRLRFRFAESTAGQMDHGKQADSCPRRKGPARDTGSQYHVVTLGACSRRLRNDPAASPVLKKARTWLGEAKRSGRSTECGQHD